MNKTDSKRIKSAVTDKDGNITVILIKYNWLTCLFHSYLSLFLLLALVGFVFSLISGWWLAAAVLFGIGIVFWMYIWVKANDNLKKRVYSGILKKHFEENNYDSITLMHYSPHQDSITVVSSIGEAHSYYVEFITEDFPLYIVKIHTSPTASNTPTSKPV